MALNGVIARNAFCNLELLSEVDILRRYISEMVRASARMTGRHLPSNGVIAKIALRDLDLLSRSNKF